LSASRFREVPEKETPMPTVDQKSTTTGLAKLAERINLAHKRGQASGRKMLQEYRIAGEALLEAKEQVAHGQWLNWLKENCPNVGERQARRYMELAKTDVTTDLEEQENRWRAICGNVDQDEFEQRASGLLGLEPGAQQEQEEETEADGEEASCCSGPRYTITADESSETEMDEWRRDQSAIRAIDIKRLGASVKGRMALINDHVTRAQLEMEPGPWKVIVDMMRDAEREAKKVVKLLEENPAARIAQS
jgi:hypothetical protein